MFHTNSLREIDTVNKIPHWIFQKLVLLFSWVTITSQKFCHCLKTNKNWGPILCQFFKFIVPLKDACVKQIWFLIFSVWKNFALIDSLSLNFELWFLWIQVKFIADQRSANPKFKVLITFLFLKNPIDVRPGWTWLQGSIRIPNPAADKFFLQYTQHLWLFAFMVNHAACKIDITVGFKAI